MHRQCLHTGGGGGEPCWWPTSQDSGSEKRWGKVPRGQRQSQDALLQRTCSLFATRDGENRTRGLKSHRPSSPLNWPLWGLGLPHPVPASKASTKWLWVEFLPPPFLWRLGRVPRAVITTAIQDNTTAIEKSAAVKNTTFVGPGPFALPSGCPWV